MEVPTSAMSVGFGGCAQLFPEGIFRKGQPVFPLFHHSPCF